MATKKQPTNQEIEKNEPTEIISTLSDKILIGETFKQDSSDPYDRATADEMMHTELSILAIRNAPRQLLERTGKCHWCGEETSGAFCSQECGIDYEKAKRAKAQRPI